MNDHDSTLQTFGGFHASTHPSMQRLFEMITQVGRSRSTVLVCGETGTGKELAAAALHRASPRHAGPFVRLNCASLSESLIESEFIRSRTGGVHRRPVATRR